jgi:hypothetical protein
VSGFSSGELQTVRLPLKSVDHRTYSSCFAHLCYGTFFLNILHKCVLCMSIINE